MANKNRTEEKRFYPDYLIEILLVVFLTLEVLVVLALLWPPGIGRMIDFTAPYQPKPEWYFLWLYQLIRYFPGRWIFVGTVVIPLLSIFLLFYIPWVDRGRWARLKVLAVSSTLLLAFIVLTLIPVL